eukprot:XP_011666486.1 PREDICTED: uncharacterized protein LOC100889498 [Strongylocentrotus purpuratus]
MTTMQNTSWPTVLSIATPNIKPRLWKRYVDDVFAFIKAESVDEHKDHLNQVDTTGSIKFTQEMEEHNSIPVLDKRITKKPDSSVKLLVYRKKAHTSHHPQHQKLGVFHTLMDRAQSIITDPDDLETETNHIEACLKRCGYPD